MLESDVKKGAYGLRHIFTGGFFEIPDQRGYNWEPEAIGQLFGDILVEYKELPNDDFSIGAILIFSKGDGKFDVLDGQKILPTFFMALCALDRMFGFGAQLIGPSEERRLQMRFYLKDREGMSVCVAPDPDVFKAPPEGLWEGSYESLKKLSNARETIEGIFRKEFESDKSRAADFYRYFTAHVILSVYETNIWRDVNRH